MQNYRSHPAILQFPSKTWYDGELVPCVTDRVARRFLDWQELHGKDFPVLFYAIRGGLFDSSAPAQLFTKGYYFRRG